MFANAYPFPPESQTGVLSALHMPLALWLAVGVAYVGGQWRTLGALLTVRRLLVLAAAAIAISLSWFIYIWAIAVDRLLEAVPLPRSGM